jgi:hypothetical protein
MTNIESIKQWFEEEFDESSMESSMESFTGVYDMVVGALEELEDDEDDEDDDIYEKANEIAKNVCDRFLMDIDEHVETLFHSHIKYVRHDLFKNIYQYIRRNGNDERVVKFVEEFTASPTYEKLNEMTYIFEREMDAKETMSETINEFVDNILHDIVEEEVWDNN